MGEKHRDLTTAERAVAAAQAWKRLNEGGKLTINKGGRGKKTNPEIGVSFDSFAKDNFKVGKDYAGRAIAIAKPLAGAFGVGARSSRGGFFAAQGARIQKGNKGSMRAAAKS